MRKICLLLAVMMTAALMCVCAQAESGADAALLLLASASDPLPADYEPEGLSPIATSKEGVNLVVTRAALLREEALEPLYQLMSAAEKDGQTLYIRQAYRSYADEARRYDLLSGSGKAAQKPGESSYQTGLSVTLVGADWKAQELSADFAESSESQWLSAHAAEYGFALRYPKGKEAVTGWSYEPWHYRYVGVTTAKLMAEQGLCLEELVADLDLAPALSSIPLPEEAYVEEPADEEDADEWAEDEWDEEARGDEAQDEEAWDDEPMDEEAWDEDEAEPEEEARPEPARKTNHSVPTVRDPSTIDPEDVGPDGDYEISIGEL